MLSGPNHVRQELIADDSQNAPAAPVRLDTLHSPRVVEHLTAGQLVSETSSLAIQLFSRHAVEECLGQNAANSRRVAELVLTWIGNSKERRKLVRNEGND